MTLEPELVETDGTPVGEFAARERAALRRAVSRSGAVLLRGRGVGSVGEFAGLAANLSTTLMPEREGFAPRTAHPGGVYSAAHWPTDQPMCMHHERSYGALAPGMLVLGCLAAAEHGGETGLACSVSVLAVLPEHLVERFERTGWLLDRRYGDLVGVSLAEAFGTEDRGQIEQYCRDNNIEYDWAADGTLHTSQHRPAVRAHPESGLRCWFNQIAFLSEWTMDSDVRGYLVDAFGRDGLPFNTRYGDGAPIEPETIATINEVYEAHTWRHTWLAGDVLLVDNIAVATSRQPSTGSRELLVALADPVPQPAASVAAS